MNWIRTGAALAFLGVALGAFGAHALKNHVSENALMIWHTAVLYQLIHAIAIFALGLYAKSSWTSVATRIKFPNTLFLIGTFLFSGSLYALAVTNIKPLGILTPFGGICFLVGWGYLAIKGI